MSALRVTFMWVLSLVGILVWAVLSNDLPDGFFEWRLHMGEQVIACILAISYYWFLYVLDEIVIAIRELVDSQYDEEEGEQ
jgi:hypothetical protein